MIDMTIVGAFLWYTVGGPILFVLSGLTGIAIFVLVFFLNKTLLRFKDIVQPPNDER